MRPITVIGGGLAGLTLGIALRKAGVPVNLWEAGRYPRHRVCGEFISGRGPAVLRNLGLEQALVDNGALLARTTAFFSETTRYGQHILPEPALCLSRFKLDALLAVEFRRLGGALREGCRWTAEFGEGVVRATGRRVQATHGWRLVGLKAHARNVHPEADLEMHFQRDRYVGICRLAHGEFNVCGLFRSREPMTRLKDNWRALLGGEAGSILGLRLQQAEFLPESFCAVAGMSLQREKACESSECVIGDAITMIPPLTGNGMSMAFESAEIASGVLRNYSDGAMNWAEATALVARRCDEWFARRLRWAKWAQAAVMQPLFARMLLSTSSTIPILWKLVFRMTR